MTEPKDSIDESDLEGEVDLIDLDGVEDNTDKIRRLLGTLGNQGLTREDIASLLDGVRKCDVQTDIPDVFSTDFTRISSKKVGGDVIYYTENDGAKIFLATTVAFCVVFLVVYVVGVLTGLWGWA